MIATDNVCQRPSNSHISMTLGILYVSGSNGGQSLESPECQPVRLPASVPEAVPGCSSQWAPLRCSTCRDCHRRLIT